MNSEMQSHYNNIKAVLTPGQHSWYSQTCNASDIAQTAFCKLKSEALHKGAGPHFSVILLLLNNPPDHI